METQVKKQATKLGGRIGFIFLTATAFLIFIAYFVLSQNFENLLTDYTITLVQAMIGQGVATVEYELQAGQDEASMLAGSFSAPAGDTQTVTFPPALAPSGTLRMVYVSKQGTVASDGRQLDLRGRQDIVQAYDGQTAVYGPYFNEQQEYVVCYSAPVYQDGAVAGVLSIEKDGYYFCDLIKDIRFSGSGEAYIINAEGTDIAVSRQEHISWVNEQYNARRLLEVQNDPTTRSILELEAKGLAGETGVGTYYWEGGLCYVAYAPVDSVHWVLLAGLRQEEIDAMTQSVLYASVTKGPTLIISLLVLLLLTALIIYWILSSMRKSAELNEKLNVMANYDPLTGALNRNSYHTALDKLCRAKYRALACVYADVNGLHEINNHLGHQAGDQMLKTVVGVLRHVFSPNDVYRIGGDEFVVLCKNMDKQDVSQRMQAVRQELEPHGYAISSGIECREKDQEIKTMVNLAEEAMQRDKQRYYQENGNERQLRSLDHKLEQMVLDKQDADAFLSVLAPEFKGVYFVDLGLDTIRHLYLPPYFAEILEEADDIFSRALSLYAQRYVSPDDQLQFETFCDYASVEARLRGNSKLEFTYQKKDGTWLKLQILKFRNYTALCRETLWIFSNKDGQ